ncbi:MAG: FadR/GntR family transcriptional regulator [Desulfobacterales bacterium]|jgi:GntR family transcriptional repressor for pyruvate dehydrogenase complex
MFQIAKQTKVFQDVVAQIQEAILDGRLKAGDTLPSERQLKNMFNISRGTLREALRVLEQKGLIEIKVGVGGGSVVKDVNADQVSESLALLIRLQKISLNHLAEFREDVEGIVAAHAAERRTEADILQLKELLNQARIYIDQGASQRDAFIEIDKQIHMTLAAAAQNPIYISVLHSVHDNIHRYYEQYLSMEEPELEENYQDLCDLVNRVEKGQADKARELARDHVRRFNRYMQKREKEEEKVNKI